MPRTSQDWTPVEHDHPLAALDGQQLAGGALRVRLGPESRFGARYFALHVEQDGFVSEEPLLTGLHHSGPLPTYNWVEVAETRERVRLPDGRAVEVGPEGIGHLWELLFEHLPAGGHLMVEYDSRDRADTALALALNVPPLATPLGAALYRAGAAAKFKDWQIAEGGSEGPRKLQAYKPPSDEQAARWRQEALQQLEAFLSAPEGGSPVVQEARQRARELLRELQTD